MTDLHKPGYCWCTACRELVAERESTLRPCQSDAVPIRPELYVITQEEVTAFVKATREKLEMFVTHAPSNHFKQILQDLLHRARRVERNLTPRDATTETGL